MPHEFLISYAGPKTCELALSDSGITLFVPKRDNFEAALELDTLSFVLAEIYAFRLGFEPRWSV